MTDGERIPAGPYFRLEGICEVIRTKGFNVGLKFLAGQHNPREAILDEVVRKISRRLLHHGGEVQRRVHHFGRQEELRGEGDLGGLQLAQTRRVPLGLDLKRLHLGRSRTGPLVLARNVEGEAALLLDAQSVERGDGRSLRLLVALPRQGVLEELGDVPPADVLRLRPRLVDAAVHHDPDVRAGRPAVHDDARAHLGELADGERLGKEAQLGYLELLEEKL